MDTDNNSMCSIMIIHSRSAATIGNMQLLKFQNSIRLHATKQNSCTLMLLNISVKQNGSQTDSRNV